MILPPTSYPLAGPVYFLTRPQLWCTAFCPFLITFVTGIISLVLSLVLALPAQAHALINAKWPAWFAWLVGIILSLVESAILTLIVFAIILPIFQDALFDATLKARGLQRLFKNRKRPNDALLCFRGTNAGLFLLWLLILTQVVVLIITLPLHVIPILGTAVACYLNGWVATWGHMIHYDLEFLSLTVLGSRERAWSRRYEYFSFGAVCVALELVPIGGLLFMWTNVVATALWVADEIEEEEKKVLKAGNVPTVTTLPVEEVVVEYTEQTQPLLTGPGQSLEEAQGFSVGVVELDDDDEERPVKGYGSIDV